MRATTMPAGSLTRQVLSVNSAVHPASSSFLMDTSVKAMLGVWATFLSLNLLTPVPLGTSRRTLPRPMEFRTWPSVAVTGLWVVGEYVTNIDLSGQKCAVAPLSRMTSCGRFTLGEAAAAVGASPRHVSAR